MSDAETVWSGCAALLRDQVSSVVWSTSFQNVEPVSFDGQALVLGFPSSVVRDRVHDRYLGLLKANLAELGHVDVDVTLEARPRDGPGAAAVRRAGRHPRRPRRRPGRSVAAGNGARPPRSTHRPGLASGHNEGGSTLNERYTFDAFVTGASNRFAHAAALRVAETPARSYNPLFIYGDAGLGKTHLLQAIGNYVLENYPNYRVRYVTSEQFLSEFVDSIRAGTNEQFKRRFRDIDVLLVDDIQFFEGKKETQEEFFHTFNHLHTSNRQIVLSLRSAARRHPHPRGPPPHPLRHGPAHRHPAPRPRDPPRHPAQEGRGRGVAGARRGARVHRGVDQRQQHPLARGRPDPPHRLGQPQQGDHHRRAGGRDPQGPRVRARGPADHPPDDPRPPPPMYFGYTVEELIGRSRTRPLTTARHVGMYLFRELTDLSFPNIAKEFGGRDHTTVIHAVDRIKTQMKERRQVFQQVTELIQQLKADG